jgi:hypothetical protein
VGGYEVAESLAEDMGVGEVGVVGSGAAVPVVEEVVVVQPGGQGVRIGQVVFVVLDVERVDERLDLGEAAWSGWASAGFGFGHGFEGIGVLPT